MASNIETSSHCNDGSTNHPNVESSSDLLTRRREKRRHLSSHALDLRNPLQVLELAVRFDESRQDEAILKEPLENGKLHDQKQFLEALKFLESQTKPPTSLQQQQQQQQQPPPSLPSNSRRTRVSSGKPTFYELLCKIFRINNKRENETYPEYALTPIILSGLLRTVRDNTAEASSSPSLPQGSVDRVGELVLTCQSMRRAAIRRVNNRQIRIKIQRNILPALSFCFLLLMYGQGIRETWQSLEALHFITHEDYSCDNFAYEYRRPCHFAEAHLWTMFEHYLLLDKCRDNDQECLTRKFGEGPLALQARFTRNLVPIEDVLDDTTSTKRELFRLGKIPHSEPALENMAFLTGGAGKERLGKSVPLLTMGDPFENADLTAFREISVLDIGCGVGAALYFLLPANTELFNYHGIALSHAEVHFAREMARRQGLEKARVFFEQRSFDEILPRLSYNLIVALESLSFSPNLENTMANLMSALQPGGILLVSDEFVLPGHESSVSAMAAARRAPSFNSILHYATLMEEYGCQVQYVREYGMEFQFEGYPSWVPREVVSLRGWFFNPWLPGRAKRLYQLRKGQEDFYRAIRQKKVDEKAGRTSYALIQCVKPDK
eukprot:scaffold6331_cov152-Amphora_coffeaeformis.AAC.11